MVLLATIVSVFALVAAPHTALGGPSPLVTNSAPSLTRKKAPVACASPGVRLMVAVWLAAL